MSKANVVLMSDFGIDSGYAACMHGMCKRVDPELSTYDITHLIPAFDVQAASYCLQYTVPYWPEGTVFVSVVDPGVGTSRKACVAKLHNGSFLVTPDNGTLTFVQKLVGIEEVRQIDETINRFHGAEDVHTFDGRDLFSYCAARLASGIITYEEVGAAYPVEEIVTFETDSAQVSDHTVRCTIQSIDPFGSVELSVLNREFAKAGFALGEKLHVVITLKGQTVFDSEVPYEKSFGYVAKGENVIFNDLASFVSIAANAAGFAKQNHLQLGEPYQVAITGTTANQ